MTVACQYLLGAVMAVLATTSLMADKSYYKDEPQFHTWPDPTAARYQIKRLGPVGIGLELIQPAFTMRVTTVEPGSPAEATGQFKKGQMVCDKCEEPPFCEGCHSKIESGSAVLLINGLTLLGSYVLTLQANYHLNATDSPGRTLFSSLWV